ncbi:MAG: S9 family peptidase [Planctomycetota bacterium]|nr:S9 family peptidase [Planctomycetota bacterium]
MNLRWQLCGNRCTRIGMGGLFLVLCTAGSAWSDDVFTFEHVAKTRSVTAAEISPDGSHVVYVLSVPRRPFKDDDGPAWAELHVVDTRGNSRPFVTGDVSVGSVAWTPDGRGISFLAKRGDDEHRSLYVIPLGGGEARKVLEHETDIKSYSWNPDGSEVAFLATEKPEKEKKELAEKGFKARVYEEDLHPVATWISPVAPAGVVVADEDDATKPRKLDLAGSASELHWSPSGDRLAVALAPTSLIDDHYMRRQVNIVNVETARSVGQLDNPGKLGHVRWSPDGRHIAVTAGADIHDPNAGRLMVGPAQGGNLRDLLPGYLGDATSIAWQGNDTVMYVGDEGVWSTFGSVNADGSSQNTIVPAGQMALRRLTLSRDGLSAAFISDSPSHPGEVFYMKHGEKQPRRLTNSNRWLDDVRLAPQEVVRYTARDGLEVEGLLIRPLDEEKGRRYPLILTVHGGPESHYSNGWLTRYASPGQLGAARGFAVFYPNYRGSTGRGVEFSKSGQNDYAGKEFDDLIDGIDHLIEMGLVDKDRVGVTGGSYGGFASAWCATYYSERFAASVMFVGISDQIAKFGTTDIPNEMFLVHSRRWPWEDWDYFRQRSPIYHFQKCRTPILIMHGEDDTRVHTSQSMELYRYLKTLGEVPVRLVLYPGEGHGNRKAASRMDYNMRMMRWMEHYLKAPGGDPPPYKLDLDSVKPKKEDEKEEDS